MTTWKEILKPKEKEFVDLINHINGLRDINSIYPASKDITVPFHLTEPDLVNVVLVSDEPEHNNDSSGLIFGSHNKTKTLSYKQRVFLRRNPKIPYGNLDFVGLAEQNVLLLNTFWTAEQGYKYAHADWIPFTEMIIRAIISMGETRPIFVGLIGDIPKHFFGPELTKKGTFSRIRCKTYDVDDCRVTEDIDFFLKEKNLPQINWSNVNGSVGNNSTSA